MHNVANAVAALQQLHQLKSVCFYGSRLTNDLLDYLTGLSIEKLNLEGTTFTDDALRHLSISPD